MSRDTITFNCYTIAMSTKDKVLQILRDNPHSAISGEKLAAQCTVSRAAIWKAVNALREQGYQIEGTTNGGYQLNCEADIVCVQSIAGFIQADFPQLKTNHIETFETIDSTNTHAKRLLAAAGSMRHPSGELTAAGNTYHKSIFVAESQTAGRGRLGRTFISPAKTGIYLTVVYAPEGGIKEPAKLTAFAAVAVKRVIERLYHVDACIKWINDIFVNGKKVCGILTEGFTNFETGTIESAIVGIGINIADNREIFEKSGSAIVGSITGVGKDLNVSRAQLAADIAAQTLLIFEEDPAEVFEQYRAASFLTGKTVQVHPIIGDESSYYDAKVIGIDEDAALIVELADKSTRHLNSGEVSLHGSDLK